MPLDLAWLDLTQFHLFHFILFYSLIPFSWHFTINQVHCFSHMHTIPLLRWVRAQQDNIFNIQFYSHLISSHLISLVSFWSDSTFFLYSFLLLLLFLSTCCSWYLPPSLSSCLLLTSFPLSLSNSTSLSPSSCPSFVACHQIFHPSLFPSLHSTLLHSTHRRSNSGSSTKEVLCWTNRSCGAYLRNSYLA